MTRTCRIATTMLIATVAIALTATASAGVIGVSHSGSNDPETQGFTVQNAASGSADGGSWSMTNRPLHLQRRNHWYGDHVGARRRPIGTALFQ